MEATNQLKSDHEFTISREFNFPRELVFKAFTEVEHLVNWWGPPGFKIGINKLELHPGGIFHYYMDTPDGGKMWGKFVYREITAPERIVFVNSFSDENEGITTHPMSPTWPKELLSIVTFAEQNGKTTVTLTGGPINASAEEIATFKEGYSSMQEGFSGTFDQLGTYLSQLK